MEYFSEGGGKSEGCWCLCELWLGSDSSTVDGFDVADTVRRWGEIFDLVSLSCVATYLPTILNSMPVYGRD